METVNCQTVMTRVAENNLKQIITSCEQNWGEERYS